MNKADERAANARSLILQGEQKMEIAKRLGYKSVGGMMGAITMLEHKEKTGKNVSHKIKRSMKPPGAEPIFRKERQEEKVDVLGGYMPQGLKGGIRVNIDRKHGLYARMEGRHLLVSYIGYRKSFNVEAKRVPGRSFRMFETELGKGGDMLEALKELHDITGRMVALLEGCDAEDQ